MEGNRILTFVCFLVILKSAESVFGHNPSVETVLFDPKDGVEILETSNFTKVVFGSEYNRIVVFYQATCGTCKKFAPVFQRLADYCKEWDHLVKFGSVACSNARNRPTCQRFKIERVPVVLFFHKNFSGAEKPIPIGSGKDFMLGNIARAMANYYERYQNLLKDWPNLLQLKKDEFSEEVDKHPNMFIVTTNDNSEKRLGPLAVLNSAKMKNARVRWMSDVYTDFLHIVDHPSLIQTKADYTTEILASSQKTNEFNKIIADKVGYKTNNLFAPINGVINLKPSKKPVAGKPITPDGVHEQDLESSLYLTLWQEIPRKRDLNNHRLGIVKRFIKNYMVIPFRPEVIAFLKKIDKKLEKISNISSDGFVKILEESCSENSYVPKRIIWTGCAGSEPKYRGKPCSLWMTFHTMTVGGLNSSNVANMMRSIKDYIVNFFSCTSCAENFAKETANLDEEIGQTDKDAILYLWKIHNKVNKRLSKEVDHVLDPRHPKIQFPGKELCENCRPDQQLTKFDEDEVFTFLKNFYGNMISDRQVYSFHREVTGLNSRATLIELSLLLHCLFIISILFVA